MLSIENEKRAHYLFMFVMLWRGLYGAFEIVLGVALIFTSSVAYIAHVLVQGELTEDQTDIVAQFISNAAQNTLDSGISFVAIYLIAYGVVKIFLVVGLLRNKLWVYPPALGIFILFATYQIYRIAYTHSVVLIIATIVDIFAIALIWHEYRHPYHKDAPAEIHNEQA